MLKTIWLTRAKVNYFLHNFEVETNIYGVKKIAASFFYFQRLLMLIRMMKMTFLAVGVQLNWMDFMSVSFIRVFFKVYFKVVVLLGFPPRDYWKSFDYMMSELLSRGDVDVSLDKIGEGFAKSFPIDAMGAGGAKRSRKSKNTDGDTENYPLWNLKGIPTHIRYRMICSGLPLESIRGGYFEWRGKCLFLPKKMKNGDTPNGQLKVNVRLNARNPKMSWKVQLVQVRSFLGNF